MTGTQATRPYVLGSNAGTAWWFLGSLVTVKAAAAQTHGRFTVVEFVNPPGFAPPLHRHLVEDECFYVLSGTLRAQVDGEELLAGPGDFVMMPAGLPHTFTVGLAEPLHVVQITAPAGFEEFVAEVGEHATERRLPGSPAPPDPVLLGHAAARHDVEILGPPRS